MASHGFPVTLSATGYGVVNARKAWVTTQMAQRTVRCAVVAPEAIRDIHWRATVNS